MNKLLLDPTDVLFFRDGRPMEGSLSGHSVAWPLPDLTNHALHAALHRAELKNVHRHVPGRGSQERDYSDENRLTHGRRFGSLKTAGPFPVFGTDGGEAWFFPRPADATDARNSGPSLLPINESDQIPHASSSLPSPLKYAVGSTIAPSKDPLPSWWSDRAWVGYISGEAHQLEKGKDGRLDADIADREQQYGIAIDAASGVAGQGETEGKIYSAHYLRLRPSYRLGLFAEAVDKGNIESGRRRDLVRELFKGSPSSIIVGGQQRVCTADLFESDGPLPLPSGISEGARFASLANGRIAVKWTLLSPALFPEICANDEKGIPAHSGGWLPTWIDAGDGKVKLRDPKESARKQGERRDQWRKRVAALGEINANLVAAVIPKPIPVTGWALSSPDDKAGQDGAKSTHLAVPAGAVYYFEAESPSAAESLALALNWHGDTRSEGIMNRRSAMMGEKGYGLGVCSTWEFRSTLSMYEK